MPLFKPNWTLLENLRNQFISESFSSGSYWTNREILEQYDHTFAQRIGWKWRSVLHELSEQNGTQNLEPMSLIDWGCGTGIASREFLDCVGSQSIKELVLLDKSPLAVQFATELISKKHPTLKVETSLSPLKKGKSILLISHVLNELSPSYEKELVSLIQKMDLVIWIEPGTPSLSRKLIERREDLRKYFRVLAPCPHQESCGLLKSKSTPHWCHFFATVPATIFRDSFWSEFSKRLKIDLRALPTSFFILAKPDLLPTASPKDRKRLLGRPRHYKGYSLALVCSQCGVQEEKLLKKRDVEIIDLISKNSLTLWIP
ncbi:methyltransferase [bacterium]|nr:methyltransferase [bacterium]